MTKMRSMAILTWALVGLITLAGCGADDSAQPAAIPEVAVMPSKLRYFNAAANYAIGTPIAPVVPRSAGGNISSYTADPALPAGLNLDAKSGIITGTPTSPVASKSYTITARNSAGSTSTVLNFGSRMKSVDSYAVGESANAQFQAVATLWKNGVGTALAEANHASSADAVAVAGTDVFVVGDDGGAVVWKNGVATRLGVAPGFRAAALAVDGSDVYVAGSTDTATMVLKNGNTLYSLPPTALTAHSLVLAGGDVYLAGTRGVGAGAVPTLYTNGVGAALGNGSASAIVAYGNDVYVAVASAAGTATIWKNGSALASPTVADINVRALAVSANDVYVASLHDLGGRTYVARLFKNGLAVPLSDDRHLSEPSAVAVAGSDAYVAFNQALKALNEGDIFDVYAARIWHNGVITELAPKSAVHDLALGWH